jgi:hypothetical protein
VIVCRANFRFILELDDRHDRAKDFLSADLHIILTKSGLKHEIDRQQTRGVTVVVQTRVCTVAVPTRGVTVVVQTRRVTVVVQTRGVTGSSTTERDYCSGANERGYRGGTNKRGYRGGLNKRGLIVQTVTSAKTVGCTK